MDGMHASELDWVGLRLCICRGHFVICTRDVKSQQEGKGKERKKDASMDAALPAGGASFLGRACFFCIWEGLSPSFSPSVRPLNGVGPFQCRCSFFCCWTRGCYVRIKHPSPPPFFPIQSSLLIHPFVLSSAGRGRRWTCVVLGGETGVMDKQNEWVSEGIESTHKALRTG